MAIIERLKEFIKTQGLKNSTFEKRAGLGNGYISKVKGSPSPEKCEDILKAFPELSREWLLTGRGEMLNSPDSVSSVDPQSPEASPVPSEVPGGSVVVLPSEAWEVIKKQADSLERKDAQMDRVISLLEDSLNEAKKMAARLDVPSGMLARSSSGGAV
jgi:hypothetical protein